VTTISAKGAFPQQASGKLNSPAAGRCLWRKAFRLSDIRSVADESVRSDAVTRLNQSPVLKPLGSCGINACITACGRPSFRGWAQLRLEGAIRGQFENCDRWFRNFSMVWRRGRDSNPRYGCPYAAFRVRCIQPLCHLSKPSQNRRISRRPGIVKCLFVTALLPGVLSALV
jgi:hypothetical protein